MIRSIEIRSKRIVAFKLPIRFNNINKKIAREIAPGKLAVEWFENSRVDSMMGGRELIKMRSHAACRRPPAVCLFFIFSRGIRKMYRQIQFIKFVLDDARTTRNTPVRPKFRIN